MGEKTAYFGGTKLVLWISIKLYGMVYMHWYIRLPFGLVISVVVFMVVLLAIYVIVYRKIGVVRWLAQFLGL